MSYSFIVRAANKAEAKIMVSAELEKVALTQPVHALDRAQTQAAADAFVDMLADDPTKTVQVNVSGWIAIAGSTDAPTCTGASLSLTTSQPARALTEAS